MATASEVRKVLLMLVTNYPYYEREIGEERLGASFDLYARLLEDIPGEILEASALAHIAESRFFPTIAELRAQAVDILMPERLTALEAWNDKSDPIAQRVRRLLPDYSDRAITIREQSVIKSLFLKTYDQIVIRERREMRRLPEIRALKQKLLEQKNSEAA